MSRFAVNLIRYRGDKEWTQQELADRSGVSRATIALYESGRRIPKYKSIVKLAKAFDVTVPDLFPEYQELETTTERDKFKMMQAEVERLSRHLDNAAKVKYVSEDSVVREDSIGYGSISPEARYIATEWDKLPPEFRGRVLTEIVNNRYEGEMHAKDSKPVDPKSREEGT